MVAYKVVDDGSLRAYRWFLRNGQSFGPLHYHEFTRQVPAWIQRSGPPVTTGRW